jgi:hypothetical protein
VLIAGGAESGPGRGCWAKGNSRNLPVGAGAGRWCRLTSGEMAPRDDGSRFTIEGMWPALASFRGGVNVITTCRPFPLHRPLTAPRCPMPAATSGPTAACCARDPDDRAGGTGRGLRGGPERSVVPSGT